MITVYSADCTDFSNNGLSVLKPIECTIHEIAGGSYELNMVHPIDSSNRWAQITNGCFIKAPAPVRESPMYEDDAEGTTEETVTRQIYKVATNGLKLRLRQEPSMDSKIIGSYPPNTEVAKLDESGAWYKVSICDGGAVGYMYGGNLTYVRDAEETITNNKPVTREAVKVIPSRDQLFRVVSVEADSETGLVTVKALHVFYDLRGNLVNDDYKPEGVAADEVVSHIASHLLNPSSITLHCYNEEPVSGDYAYKSAVEALLDPDEGVLTKSDSLLIRDNFDAYLIPNQTRDMGVTVRRGKNLVGAVVTYDSSDIVTRIIPVGKDKDGNDLFLDGTIYVDSPHINDYPTVFSVRKDYNVRVVKKDPDNVTTFTSIDDARAELRDLALDEFDAGVDVPSYSIDVDFVLLSQAQGYEDYADLQSIHMYDTVTVIDSMIGLNTKIKMTEYEWDCLAGMYNSVKLCDAQSVEQTVYSYNLPTGGVSGSKISTGSLSGNAIRSASIDYAKINNAAIDQLTADSITAVRATIHDLVTHQITTDQLYADLADIAVAQITTANINQANINWAQIQNLVSEIATVATAEIGSAKISYANIYDLNADTALIRQGVAGDFFFDKLSVSSAQMVDLTVGQLTVKASDNNYYSLDVDLDTGNVTANQVTVTQAEIDAGKTSTGNHIIETDLTVTELSTSSAKATEALINKLTAQRIDVAELFAQQAFIAALDANMIKASNINALEGQLNVWANDKIQLAVDNVQVGGRNLITNSEAITLAAGSGNFVHTGLYYPLVNNQQYTISFGSVVQTAGSAPAYLTLNGYCSADNADFRAARVLISTERQSYTFTTPDDGRAYRLIIYHGVAGSATAGNAFTLNNVKLEIGNKATDWTPAPEDTDAAITATRSMISQTSSEIRAEVSEMQVGGRNLILDSNVPISKTSYHIVSYVLSPTHPLVAGSHFSLRIWGTLGSDRANFTAFNTGGNGNTDYLGAPTDNGDGTYTLHGTWKVGTGNTHLLLYAPPVAGTSTSTITRIKLESGDKCTDWTPAPEDVSVPLSGMNNLYSTGDSVSGYLTAAGGVAIGTAENTDTTSDYIAVTPGETLTFQCWVTPLMGTAHYLWMGYGFFDSSKTWMSSPGRTAQNQGANTGTFQYRYITFTVPAGAAYIRISGRMYADGRMKLERNAEPTPYRDAAAELVNTSMTINRKGFFVNTSGIVGINAVDSQNESYIYMGDILELDDQGGLKAKVGNFTQSLKVNGNSVAALPYPVIFSRTTPTSKGVIWIQPTAAISAQYSSPSDTSRNSRLHFGYYGSTSASLPAFTFSAVGTDTVGGTGNKTYRLEFDIYSLTDLSSVTASFSATATKSGSTVNFGASSTYTLKKYQQEHITLTATSTTNLCANTSAISVTIKATGSNLNKIFVQSNQTMLLNCAAAASSGQQACNLIFIP